MRSFIEILESRIAPASVVNVSYAPATGALDINAGDNFAHHVHVFPTGANTFRVEALDDTTITTGGVPGNYAVDYTGQLTAVSYLGGNDDDAFAINNFKSITTLSFDGLDDVDTLDVRDVTTTGDVTITLGGQTLGTGSGAAFSGLALTIGGNVIADYGSGGGYLNFDAITNTVKGGLLLTGGTAADNLYVGGQTTTIAKGIKFAGDAGDDYLSLNAGAVTVGKAADGRSILFDGGQDADELAIYGNGLVSLPGKVQFDGGAGHNVTTVVADGLTIGGDLAVTGGDEEDTTNITPLVLKVGGEVSMSLGGGKNDTRVFALSMTVAKAFSYTGGAGDDTFRLAGTSVILSRGLSLTLGDSDVLRNEVDISPRIFKVTAPSALLPALSIVGGAQVDDIDIDADNVTVTGETRLDGGAGTNSIHLEPLNGTFTKDLKITGLGGADTVLLDAGSLKVMGAASINLGEGTNVVEGYVPSATFSKSLTYLGGAGDDSLTLGGTMLKVTGAVDLGLGGGMNEVHIDAATTTFSNTLNVTGGAGANTFDLGSIDPNVMDDVAGRILAVAKATTIAFGSGNNKLYLGAPQSSFGALTVTTLGGADTVELSGTKLGATGLVKFDVGGGIDHVTIYSAALALKAGLTVLGGDNADEVNLIADGTITGDVFIDLGAAEDADQSIQLSGNSGFPGILKVTGALTLSSSANGVMGYSDLINVVDVTVTKAISATAGAANSAIAFNNTSTGNKFTIVSGAGKDDVQIETAGTFGGMTIGKETSIDLGDGNEDNLTIGYGDDSNRVRFLGAVVIDGGPGSLDTVDINANTIYGPGVIAPVPSNVP